MILLATGRSMVPSQAPRLAHKAVLARAGRHQLVSQAPLFTKAASQGDSARIIKSLRAIAATMFAFGSGKVQEIF